LQQRFNVLGPGRKNDHRNVRPDRLQFGRFSQFRDRLRLKRFLGDQQSTGAFGNRSDQLLDRRAGERLDAGPFEGCTYELGITSRRK
jgi:hypothetical protein